MRHTVILVKGRGAYYLNGAQMICDDFVSRFTWNKELPERIKVIVDTELFPRSTKVYIEKQQDCYGWRWDLDYFSETFFAGAEDWLTLNMPDIPKWEQVPIYVVIRKVYEAP